MFGSKKPLSVRVSTVDEEFDFDVAAKATGDQLFSQVVKYMQLNEYGFFGFKYINVRGEESWLRLDRKITSQPIQKERPIQLKFRVQFFPEDVGAEIIEDKTLRLFYHQVRHAILSDAIYCPAETAVWLSSYAVQAKYGDYSQETNRPGYLANDRLLPQRVLDQFKITTGEWEQRISRWHQEHHGMLKEEAMLEYLKIAQDLEMYGITYFDVKNKRGTQLYLGIDALGINIYERSDKLAPKVGFPWSEIGDIMAEGNKTFVIRPNDKGAPKMGFKTGSAKTILLLSKGNYTRYIKRRQPEDNQTTQLRAMAEEHRMARKASHEQRLHASDPPQSPVEEQHVVVVDSLNAETEGFGGSSDMAVVTVENGEVHSRKDSEQQLTSAAPDDVIVHEQHHHDPSAPAAITTTAAAIVTSAPHKSSSSSSSSSTLSSSKHSKQPVTPKSSVAGSVPEYITDGDDYRKRSMDAKHIALQAIHSTPQQPQQPPQMPQNEHPLHQGIPHEIHHQQQKTPPQEFMNFDAAYRKQSMDAQHIALQSIHNRQTSEEEHPVVLRLNSSDSRKLSKQSGKKSLEVQVNATGSFGGSTDEQEAVAIIDQSFSQITSDTPSSPQSPSMDSDVMSNEQRRSFLEQHLQRRLDEPQSPVETSHVDPVMVTTVTTEIFHEPPVPAQRSHTQPQTVNGSAPGRKPSRQSSTKDPVDASVAERRQEFQRRVSRTEVAPVQRRISQTEANKAPKQPGSYQRHISSVEVNNNYEKQTRRQQSSYDNVKPKQQRQQSAPNHAQQQNGSVRSVQRPVSAHVSKRQQKIMDKFAGHAVEDSDDETGYEKVHLIERGQSQNVAELPQTELDTRTLVEQNKKLKSELDQLRNELSLLRTGTKTQEDKKSEELQKQGKTKYQTLKQIRAGTVKRRVDQFENL